MTTQMFVNLPVKDLDRSVEFFTRLGFEFNQQLSDEKGSCLVINEDSSVMLVTEELFHLFTSKQICEPQKCAGVAISLSTESKEKVDDLISKAIEAGGSEAAETQDLEWMYGRSFEDLDNHIWALFHIKE